ncbi:helix-turn-helix domain-containing protein [Falsiruegeria litorea]|uniref:Helix-turn-helix domain-containing protein n=1 Tax=Falsiruegeria litorea TaxID=1280831 RepID=A0ABS5WLT8_9RHOB|nr:helix-turn-helix domain-containing protein [Falsiruegeria litorea]MBT3139726.1 helix-turn-helix domain-containing protein [Falsiruegeria litorea]MBT8169820.1 helix-turn-helix domain-containing protein [Falsiruegeria litorea]
MSQQLIAVDANALDQVLDRLASLEQKLASVTVTQNSEWLSIPKAAAQLGCSESTIRRKIDSGELSAKGSGKSRRVKL